VKMAWRNLRRSPAASAFTAVTMAVSIASIVGINGVTALARDALGQDTKAWLGGDVAVDTGESISEDQLAALDRMRGPGVDWTLGIMVLTSVSSSQSADPGYVGVKVIDPTRYPFYGMPALEPPQTFAQALTEGTVAVSENVLTRMHVHAGESIRIGGAPFRISAVFASDTDRFMGILGFGMRCVLSESGYDRTGIARGGNSVKYRVLLRLPSEVGIESAKSSLQSLFPEGNVIDYRDANLQAAANVESAISFLGAIAFLTLAFSAIGVAIAARHHVEHRMTAIAVMKAVGAQGSQTTVVLFVEIAYLLFAAVAAGLPMGLGLRLSMISLARKFVILNAHPSWHVAVILQSAGAGVLAMLPLLMRPTLAIRSVRPAIVLRRDAEETPLPRLGRSMPVAAFAIAATAFLAVVVRLIGSWIWASILMTALSLSFGIAMLLAAAGLGLMKRSASGKLRRVPSVRLGLASLNRPGNRSRSLVVALSVGVMLIVATFDSSRSVLKIGMTTLPYAHSSLFIAGFEESHRASFRTFLESVPGVESVDIKTQARLRLKALGGVPVERLAKSHGSFYIARCNPDDGVPARDPAEIRKLTIGDDLAARLGVRVGTRLEFSTRDEVIPAVVTGIRKLQPEERFWFTLSIDCRDLTADTVFHSAEIQARPGQIAKVQSAVGVGYPTLPVISAEDIHETILGVADDAAKLTRLVASYAMAAGFSVLIAVVAASRRTRLREIGILAALGGVRKTIVKICTVEFAAIGVLAGFIGGVLAFGFTSVVVSAIFRSPQAASGWYSIPAGILIGAPAAVVAGWLPTYRLLRRKPMEVLRDE
jgi:putative ABC transport system permease protein